MAEREIRNGSAEDLKLNNSARVGSPANKKRKWNVRKLCRIIKWYEM